ncbi:DUF1643 domain-containing protein [Mesobacterium sp. TK19101]|uniref:DUF1643 domain-containing protein n=1 Tax=Mesobacterium hydrothermale TaxID=3111907 RepID=A0ABU6HLU3_9RHOB|nr:DUF1643 domain-containing protein [Mesobacterium sp. TK19101]MEC3863347.1 DUF1643 domain-containing protein [Mesobacterium sp. TK19101]
MIRRRHSTDETRSVALFSDCGAYRYGLSRYWNRDAGTVLFVMLNPSTADHRRNDPTIARCENRARAMGFGTLLIANLFGFRATLPRDLKRAQDPFGPDNDALLRRWHRTADMTIAAWGVHGAFQGADVRGMAQFTGPLHHLGLTKAGHPRHPLYVPNARKPILWER